MLLLPAIGRFKTNRPIRLPPELVVGVVSPVAKPRHERGPYVSPSANRKGAESPPPRAPGDLGPADLGERPTSGQIDSTMRARDVLQDWQVFLHTHALEEFASPLLRLQAEVRLFETFRAEMRDKHLPGELCDLRTAIALRVLEELSRHSDRMRCACSVFTPQLNDTMQEALGVSPFDESRQGLDDFVIEKLEELASARQERNEAAVEGFIQGRHGHNIQLLASKLSHEELKDNINTLLMLLPEQLRADVLIKGTESLYEPPIRADVVDKTLAMLPPADVCRIIHDSGDSMAHSDRTDIAHALISPLTPDLRLRVIRAVASRLPSDERALCVQSIMATVSFSLRRKVMNNIIAGLAGDERMHSLETLLTSMDDVGLQLVFDKFFTVITPEQRRTLLSNYLDTLSAKDVQTMIEIALTSFSVDEQMKLFESLMQELPDNLLELLVAHGLRLLTPINRTPTIVQAIMALHTAGNRREFAAKLLLATEHAEHTGLLRSQLEALSMTRRANTLQLFTAELPPDRLSALIAHCFGAQASLVESSFRAMGDWHASVYGFISSLPMDEQDLVTGNFSRQLIAHLGERALRNIDLLLRSIRSLYQQGAQDVRRLFTAGLEANERSNPRAILKAWCNHHFRAVATRDRALPQRITSPVVNFGARFEKGTAYGVLVTALATATFARNNIKDSWARTSPLDALFRMLPPSAEEQEGGNNEEGDDAVWALAEASAMEAAATVTDSKKRRSVAKAAAKAAVAAASMASVTGGFKESDAELMMSLSSLPHKTIKEKEKKARNKLISDAVAEHLPMLPPDILDWERINASDEEANITILAHMFLLCPSLGPSHESLRLADLRTMRRQWHELMQESRDARVDLARIDELCAGLDEVLVASLEELSALNQAQATYRSMCDSLTLHLFATRGIPGTAGSGGGGGGGGGGAKKPDWDGIYGLSEEKLIELYQVRPEALQVVLAESVDAETEVQDVQALVAEHVFVLSRIFTVYANMGGHAHILNMAEFKKLAGDCHLVGPTISGTRVELTFLKHAQTEELKQVGADGKTHQGLLPHEFCEALAVIAWTKYHGGGGGAQARSLPLATCVQKLFDSNVFNNAHRSDVGLFRMAMKRPRVQAVLNDVAMQLVAIYDKYRHFALADEGRDEFTLATWLRMVSDKNLGINGRMCEVLFNNAQRPGKLHEHATLVQRGLSHEEFLEAIASLAMFKFPNPYVSLPQRIGWTITKLLSGERRGAITDPEAQRAELASLIEQESGVTKFVATMNAAGLLRKKMRARREVKAAAAAAAAASAESSPVPEGRSLPPG